ncbi:MAG TPA: nucleotide-binding protein [Albitalea sp.]
MKHSIVRMAWLLAALGPVAYAAPTLQAGSISGEVMQTQNVDSYTYVRLKTAEGEIWAAVEKAPLKNGERITIGNASMLQNFQSKSLNKTFDRIVFGQLANPRAAAPVGGKSTPAAAAGPAIQVDKAKSPDAKTVAEVVKGRTSLKDKGVTVRAKVVKVNRGIMGKNWLHLQDGSGSAADGTNDVIVTTKDMAALGDVVTVKGTVRTDVKLGSGYDYAVLIEEASVRK